METIYFILFCLAIAYVIFWSLKNDDLADFDDPDGGNKKFSPGKGSGSRKTGSK